MGSTVVVIVEGGTGGVRGSDATADRISMNLRVHAMLTYLCSVGIDAIARIFST